MNKVKYYEIKNALNYYNVNPNSKIKDTELFHSLSSLNSANENQLTFFHDRSKLKELKNTKAKACLINKDNLDVLPLKCIPIIVNDPYKAFAILSNVFTSSNKSNGEISKFSSIDNNSKIGNNVQIDPFVVIKENCNIGKNVIIESNCVIGPNVKIGDNSVIKSNSILLECLLGMNCTVKSGAIIGGAGFGFDAKSKILISHNGNVIIKDNCHIGSNTTIDRAVFDSTFISENSFIGSSKRFLDPFFVSEASLQSPKRFPCKGSGFSGMLLPSSSLEA